MATQTNFTAPRIAAAVCPAGKTQAFLWDSKVQGLGLRTTAQGANSYIFQGKLNGATIRLTIGSPRTWSIEKARERAREFRTLIDNGIDPRQYRAEQTAAGEARKAEALRHDASFGTTWDAYLATQKSRWGERHYRDHVNYAAEGGTARKRGSGVTVPGPLAPLRAKKLSELTGEFVAAWLASQTAARPTMCAHAYRLLKAFIRWANDTPAYRGVIPVDAYNARCVRDVVPKVKSKEGDCLQREQLHAWFEAVASIQNTVISVYLQGLILTGARREELAALKWADVDFKWRSLSLSDKVEDGGRMVALTPYLSAKIAALPRRNEWVFSSLTAADGKIAEPRLAHNKALAVAGLPHITLHGLRRTFITLAEWCEAPTGLVAQITGHKPSGTAEKHYIRRPLSLLRKWHEKIEAWMLEEAGIDFKVEEPGKLMRVVL